MVRGGLGAHVGGMIVEHDRRGRRTDLNDRSAARHRADHRLEKLERADELQRAHLLQLLGGVFEEGPQQSPARGVERNRHAAHAFATLASQRFELRLSRDVAGKRKAADFAGEAFQFIHAPSGDQYLRAFVAKPLGDDLCHIVASGRAQYHRRFPFQASHIGLPSR